MSSYHIAMLVYIYVLNIEHDDILIYRIAIHIIVIMQSFDLFHVAVEQTDNLLVIWEMVTTASFDRPGVRVTRPIFSIPLFFPFFRVIKTLLIY